MGIAQDVIDEIANVASNRATIITGAAKTIAGGLGAVPTAVGKTIEQIPAGVGKLIGAIPKQPADYSSNPSLDLAGEGISQMGRGFSDVGNKARTGLMSAFGLKEAPPSTLPAAAVPLAATPPTSQPQPAVATQETTPIASGGVSPETFSQMQEVGRRAVAQSAPQGMGDYDVSRTGRNEYTMTPKGKPPEPDSNLGPIAATRELRDQYNRERVANEYDARIRELKEADITPGNKAKLINDLLAKKVDLLGQGLTMRGQDIQERTTGQGHGVTTRGQDVTSRTAAEGHEIERQKIQRQIAETDMKNPVNVAKLVLQHSPKKTVFKLDDLGTKIGQEEVPDIATGLSVLRSFGVPIDEKLVSQYFTKSVFDKTNRPPLDSFKKK
jgi:hypothetical protein